MDSVKLHMTSSSSIWWLAVKPNNDNNQTTKVELKDSQMNDFLSLKNNPDWGYYDMSSTSNVGYSVPLTFRLSSSSVPNIVPDQMIDTGATYGPPSNSNNNNNSNNSNNNFSQISSTFQSTTSGQPTPIVSPTFQPTSHSTNSNFQKTSFSAKFQPNSPWPNGPLKAIYIDIGIDWNNPSSTFKTVVDSGYNYIVLAFLVSNTVFDAATAWSQMTTEDKKETINYAHSRNVRIVVSAGGATDSPYSSMTGSEYGTFAANWANDQFLDGVDFDLENFGQNFSFNSLSTEATIKWVVEATNTARCILGNSKIISHAPQPPYFGNIYYYSNAYTHIYKQAPSINFLMVQYYNNGAATTYESIFTQGEGKTSVKEIAELGIPLNKIIVGKPVKEDDASTMWISAQTFHSFVSRAKQELGWDGGVMGWQWHDLTTNSSWINTIYK